MLYEPTSTVQGLSGARLLVVGDLSTARKARGGANLGTQHPIIWGHREFRSLRVEGWVSGTRLLGVRPLPAVRQGLDGTWSNAILSPVLY
jgi:hypothetical protein